MLAVLRCCIDRDGGGAIRLPADRLQYRLPPPPPPPTPPPLSDGSDLGDRDIWDGGGGGGALLIAAAALSAAPSCPGKPSSRGRCRSRPPFPADVGLLRVRIEPLRHALLKPLRRADVHVASRLFHGRGRWLLRSPGVVFPPPPSSLATGAPEARTLGHGRRRSWVSHR